MAVVISGKQMDLGEEIVNMLIGCKKKTALVGAVVARNS